MFILVILLLMVYILCIPTESVGIYGGFRVDRVKGPLNMVHFPKVFGRKELYLFGEFHMPPYNEKTCKKKLPKDSIIMTAYELFAKLMKDKNTYLLAERVPSRNVNCDVCHDRNCGKVLMSDITKLKKKTNNPRIIYIPSLLWSF